MTKNRSFVWGLVVTPLALLGLSVALASNVSVPHDFQAGTPAIAAEVNQNFGAVAAAINDNDARISLNDSRLTSIEGGAIDGTIKAAAIIDANAAQTSVARSFHTMGLPVTVTELAGTGYYEVDFGFDLTNRYWMVSLGHPAAAATASGIIDTALRSGNPNAIWVRTKRWDAVAQQMVQDDFQDFYVLVY